MLRLLLALLLVPAARARPEGGAAEENLAKACKNEISLLCGGKINGVRGCLDSNFASLLPTCREALDPAGRRPGTPRASYKTAPIDPADYPDDAPVAQPDKDLTVIQKYAYYSIRGTTTEELLRQMKDLGPAAHGGARTDAGRKTVARYVPAGTCLPITSWKFEYDPKWKLENGQYQAVSCGFKSLHVELKIIITLPRWEVPVGARPEFVERFRQTLKDIKTHEHCHGDIAIGQWKSFTEQARNLKATTCEELGQALTSLSARLASESKDRNADFDEAAYDGRDRNGWDCRF